MIEGLPSGLPLYQNGSLLGILACFLFSFFFFFFGQDSCLDRVELTIGVAVSVTKQDIEEHFGSHGSGKITEIKLMSGFGFIEYEDAMDARDVVPGKNFLFTCLARLQ